MEQDCDRVIMPKYGADARGYGEHHEGPIFGCIFLELYCAM